MRTYQCHACSAASPAGETYRLRGAPHCRACAARLMKDPLHPVLETEVEPMADLSICHRCRRSDGEQDLPLVHGRPTCKACLEEAKGLRFPRWLKGSFAGALALTCVCYAHSLKYILGYVEYRRAVKAFHTDRDADAARLMEAAARRLPEEVDYQALAAFYRGWELEGKDDVKAALPFLKKARDLEPEDKEYRMYLLAAERAAAFEAGDYGAALKKSQAMMDLYGETEETFRALASAQSANFVATGDDTFRAQALATLARLRAAKDLNQERARVTENWLQHRMAMKEIIGREAFEKRFPQGWRAEGGN